MQNIGQYILHVGLAALLVGIICEFSDRKSSTGMLTRMICGLFLAFTVINPLTELNFDILESFSGITTQNGQQAVSAGTSMAEESTRTIIRQEYTAYILDKDITGEGFAHIVDQTHLNHFIHICLRKLVP